MKEKPLDAIQIKVRTFRGSPPPILTVHEDLRSTVFEAPRRHVVVFEAVHVQNVDFSSSDFFMLAASGSTFEDCSFAGAKIRSGQFHGMQTLFRRCDFSGTDLRNIPFDCARCEHCLFDKARIDHWNAETAEFVGCRFAGVLREVNFWGRPDEIDLEYVHPPRTLNEFHGNDFRETELRSVAFKRGIDIRQQLLPEDESHVLLDRIGDRIARSIALVKMQPATAQRTKLLQGLEIWALVRADQQDAIVHRADLSERIDREVLRLLIDAFETPSS